MMTSQIISTFDYMEKHAINNINNIFLIKICIEKYYNSQGAINLHMKNVILY